MANCFKDKRGHIYCQRCADGVRKRIRLRKMPDMDSIDRSADLINSVCYGCGSPILKSMFGDDIDGFLYGTTEIHGPIVN